jgi:hypothetical protein
MSVKRNVTGRELGAHRARVDSRQALRRARGLRRSGYGVPSDRRRSRRSGSVARRSASPASSAYAREKCARRRRRGRERAGIRRAPRRRTRRPRFPRSALRRAPAARECLLDPAEGAQAAGHAPAGDPHLVRGALPRGGRAGAPGRSRLRRAAPGPCCSQATRPSSGRAGPAKSARAVSLPRSTPRRCRAARRCRACARHPPASASPPSTRARCHASANCAAPRPALFATRPRSRSRRTRPRSSSGRSAEAASSSVRSASPNRRWRPCARANCVSTSPRNAPSRSCRARGSSARNRCSLPAGSSKSQSRSTSKGTVAESTSTAVGTSYASKPAGLSAAAAA